MARTEGLRSSTGAAQGAAWLRVAAVLAALAVLSAVAAVVRALCRA